MASQQETAANAAPQHAKRWRIVAAAFVTMAHAPGLHYAYGTLMVALMEANISTSRALLGGVGSLSTGAMLSGAYVSGRLQSRFGAARVVAAGGAVAAAGLALSAAATELWQLYVNFGLVVGLGHSLAFPPCPVAVAVAFSGSSDAALASGVATAGSGAGTIVLGVAARLLIVAAGWRATFGALALSTSIFVVGLAAPTLRRPQNRKPAAPVRETRPPQTPPLLTPRLRLLCGVVFTYAWAWEVPFVHLVAYAGDAGHAAAAASLVVVFVGAGGSLGRVAVARAADAKGVQPTFRAMLLAIDAEWREILVDLRETWEARFTNLEPLITSAPSSHAAAPAPEKQPLPRETLRAQAAHAREARGKADDVHRRIDGLEAEVAKLRDDLGAKLDLLLRKPGALEPL